MQTRLRQLSMSLAIAMALFIGWTAAAHATTYYVSPDGDDSNSGLAESQPWGTFSRAWQDLGPGDTLVLLDGVYYESFVAEQDGEPGNPITIRARNDGKAIIDGEYQRTPVSLGSTIVRGNHFVIEGIVARNSNDSVFQVRTQDVVLRRVSGYNANVDANTDVFTLWGKDILLEDCIAAGTGRKMILIFMSENVTVRRCFTQWERWDGKGFCAAGWPAGSGVNIYNSAHVRVENAISTGPLPDRSIAINSNHDTVYSPGIEILGSIAMGAGMNADGTVRDYGPAPNECGFEFNYDWPDQRAGFGAWGQGTIEGPVFRDLLATNNAGLGLAIDKPYGVGVVSGIVDHITLYGNGIDAPEVDGGKGSEYRINGEAVVTNSNIEGDPDQQGEGARLHTRYIDGVLTDQPLWPWPMDDRAQAELGFDITGLIEPLLQGQPPVPVPGFSVSVQPTYQVIEPGSSTAVTVTVEPYGGFDQQVEVVVSNSSPDLTINPQDTLANPGDSVVLGIQHNQTSSASSEVAYSIPIRVSGGAKEQTVTAIIYLDSETVDLGILFLPMVQDVP
ncbi:MAG: hypothetical protein H3C34_27625 [Caldilineaceae bacterium]|nr:hypothetical protein [Caldilineaceae bacterium]